MSDSPLKLVTGQELAQRAVQRLQASESETLANVMHVASFSDPAAEAEKESVRRRLRLGADVELPDDLTELMRQAKQRDAQDFLNEMQDPGLRARFKDVKFVRLLHDDLGNLKDHIGTLDWWHRNYESGDTLNELGFLQARAAMARSNNASLSPQEQDRIAEIDYIQKAAALESGVFDEAAKLIGQMAAPLAKSLATGGAAAGAASLGGSIGAGTAFVWGTGAAMAAQTAVTEFGHQYASIYQSLRDADVDEKTAHDTAMVTAGAYSLGATAVEMLGMGVVAKPFVGAGRTIGAKLLAKAGLTAPTAGKAAGSFLKNTLLGGAAETGEEGIQELLGAASENVAGAMTDSGTGPTLSEALTRAGEVMWRTAKGMAVLAPIGPALQYASEIENVQRAKGSQELFGRMAETAKKSELLKRSPDTFAQLVEARTVGTAMETVHIEAPKLVEALQKAGQTRAQFEHDLPEVAKALKEAEKTGDDVAIPMGEFAAKIAPTDLYPALKNSIRLGNGWSLDQAETWMSEQAKNREASAAKVATAAAKIGDWAAQAVAVEDRIAGELKKDTRIEPERVKLYAALHRQWVEVQAASEGLSPAEFDAKHRLTISVNRADGATVSQFVSQYGAGWDVVKRKDEMVAAGATPHEILKETGLQQGTDGSWMFELDDSKSKWASSIMPSEEDMAKAASVGRTVRVGDLSPGKWTTLDSVLDHPELFEKVPALKKISVQVFTPEQSMRGEKGYYHPRKKMVALRSDLTIEEGFRILHHEIQHAIQDDANFARGGSPDFFSPQELSAIEIADAKRLISASEGTPMRADVDEFMRLDEEEFALTMQIQTLPSRDDPRVEPLREQLRMVMRATQTAFGRLSSEGLTLLKALQSQQPGSNVSAPVVSSFDAYRRLAGETQARNTADHRLHLTAEQRREKLAGETADVPPEAQIVRPGEMRLSQSVPLMEGEEDLSDYGLPRGEKATVREVGTALEARQIDKFGKTDPSDRSEASSEKIANWMVAEVLHELKGGKSGGGWYSHLFQRALDTLAKKFPELATDKAARNHLTILIAITSDGQDPGPNLKHAIDIYSQFRQQKKFVHGTRSTARAASIASNIDRLGLLYEAHGDGMHEFLLQERTVKELKKFAKTKGLKFSSGHQAKTKLPLASVVLGPKLGAFYANLMGAHGYLTMDRWWSRTFNRYRGTLVAHPTPSGIQTVRKLLLKKLPKGTKLTDEEVLQATKALRKSYEAKDFKKGTKAEKAGNTVFKAAFLDLEDTPFGAKDRTFMVETTARAQKLLAEQGVELTIADIQAVLWYYEKKLYATLGAKASNKISYLDAAEAALRDQNDEQTGRRDPDDGGRDDEADDGVVGGVQEVGAERLSQPVADDTGGLGSDQTDAGAVQDGRGVRGDAGKVDVAAGPQPDAPPLAGLPATVELDGQQVAFGPSAAARRAAINYMRDAGLPYNPATTYAEVDVERAKRIAAAFEEMKHAPNDPEVRAAYRAAADETIGQYRAMLAAGVTVEFNPAEGDPYGNPRNALLDLKENNHLFVFSTEDGYGRGITDEDRAENPMLQDSGYTFGGRKALVNDLFRAVHDYFGHFKEGVGFRARGEENAWQQHMAMFSPLARRALTTETRGQNSWVNFGPHAEANKTASGAATVYAEQKIGLLPEWVATEGYLGGAQRLAQPAGVGSPEFQAWFGESKVVDESGAPLVVYHGTLANFTEFRVGGEHNFLGSGIYFSESSDVAAGYAGSRADDLDATPQGASVIPVYLRAEKPFRISGTDALRSLMQELGVASTGQLQKVLEAQGFDSIIFSPDRGTSLYGVKDFGNIISVFSPTQIKSATGNRGTFERDNPNVLEQSKDREARGEFEPSTNTIFLNPKADPSTVLHEMSHFWLTTMFRMASLPTASERVKKDAQTLLSWFGVADLATWNAMSLKEQERHHEAFAYNAEAHFFGEGKAPTRDPEQMRMFRSFGRWVRGVYRHVRDVLNASYRRTFGVDLPGLTPDVRSVFDRMVAAEDAIAAAQMERSAAPMLDKKPEGMSEEGWISYVQTQQQATDEATESLQSESLRAMKWLGDNTARMAKLLQRETRKIRKQIEAEERDKAEALPVYRARAALAAGEIALDDGGKVPMKLRAFDYHSHPLAHETRDHLVRGLISETGQSADTLAPMFGYTEGYEMVRDLISAPPIEEVVTQKADERMLAEHTDLLDPAKMRLKIEAVLHNDARMRMVAAELRWLSKTNSPVRLMVRASREFAREVIGGQRVGSVRPHQHAQAEVRHRREAERALAKGDHNMAATHKRLELLEAQKERVALEVREEIDALKSLVKKLFRSDKKLAASRDVDYVSVARYLATAFGLVKTDVPAAAQIEQLRNYNPELFARLEPQLERARIWAERAAAEGRSVQSWGDLTVDEFRDLGESISALWNQSIREKQFQDGRKLVELDDLATELQAEDAKLPPAAPAPVGALTTGEKFGRAWHRLKQLAYRPENWALRRDGGDKPGVFTRLFWNPVRAAVNRYVTSRNTYTKRIADMVKKLRPNLKQGVIEFRDPQGNLLHVFGRGNGGFGHAEFVAALLHTGNRGNLERLIVGRKWGTLDKETDILDVSNWNHFLKQMIDGGYLTKDVMDFVQSVWDLNEETKPLAQRAHKQLFGFYFKEIEATSVEMPWGSYRGGYMPAKLDPTAPSAPKNQSLADREKDFRQQFATTGRGFTRERAEFFAEPLLLDLDLVPSHIDDVLRFSHLQPVVRDVERLAKQKDVAALLESRQPGVWQNMLLPWLQRVASQSITKAGKNTDVDRFWSFVRSSAGISTMFANVANAMQQATGLLVAALKVKPRFLFRGLGRLLHERGALVSDIAEKSEFMRDRQNRQTFDSLEQIADLTQNRSKFAKTRAWVRKHAYFMQAHMQNMVDSVVWSAAYEQELQSQKVKVSDDDANAAAVLAADAAVRQTQSSFDPTDVAGYEEGTPFYRLLTMFSGYFNTLANLQADRWVAMSKQAGWAKAGPALYLYLLGFAAPALLADAISRTLRGQWDDEDDDGDVDVLTFDYLFMGQLRSALAEVPVAGPSLLAPILNSFDPKPWNDRMTTSPAITLLERSVGGTADALKAVVGLKQDRQGNVVGPNGEHLRDVMTGIGTALGVPLGFLGSRAGYVQDVAQGRISPAGTWDAIRAMISGAAGKQAPRQP